MARVLGLDVGGANTKIALVETRRGFVERLGVGRVYFPIWRRGLARLPGVLRRLREEVAHGLMPDAVGVTMTAELSDAYFTKGEGVNHVLDCVEKVFPGVGRSVVDCWGRLRSFEEARSHHLEVAGANWAAEAWMAGRMWGSCLVVDVGSTTADIVPVLDGRVAVAGRTDMERLASGELVYTGALRTNVAAICKRIPVRGMRVRVSSELFATSGDAHLVLGNIRQQEYDCDTADGRGVSRREAMARLARVVCADIEMLREEDVVEIAKYVQARQVEELAEGVRQVYGRLPILAQTRAPVVVAGIGRRFLAWTAAEAAGAGRVLDLAELIGVEAASVAPSVGAAVMAASELEGQPPRWKRL